MSSWRQQGHSRSRDANEAEIIAALRRAKHFVIALDEPCDLAVQVACCARWFLLEVKNPERKGSRSKANPRELTVKQLSLEQQLHEPIPVVETGLEAQMAVERHRCS